MYAVIDAEGHLAALIEDDNWSGGDGMQLVDVGEFSTERDYYDWVWDGTALVLDDDGIAERELARQLEPREVLAALFQAEPETMAALPDEVLAHMASYMAEWVLGVAYSIGDIRQYGELPYRCLQDHTSQEGYEPDVAVSLWARILIPDPSVIPEWEQPSSTNPYMKGDKVRHSGKVWESLIDYNVYEPGTVGTENIWQEVA